MKEQFSLHVHPFLRALFFCLFLCLSRAVLTFLPVAQDSIHVSPLTPFEEDYSVLQAFFSFMRDFFLQMKLYEKVQNIQQGCSAWRKCGTQEPHLVGFLLIPLAESSRSSKKQTFKPTALLLFVLSLLLIKTCQS